MPRDGIAGSDENLIPIFLPKLQNYFPKIGSVNYQSALSEVPFLLISTPILVVYYFVCVCVCVYLCVMCPSVTVVR